MTIQLIGLNHQTTPLAMREKLYLQGEALYEAIEALHSRGLEECAILSTCNRLEIYFLGDSSLVMAFLSDYYGMETLKPYLYHCEGEAVVKHLMMVASGLDSLILGEAQILGQVSKALETAHAATILHRLFEAAIHAGKRARHESPISQHSTSVSHAAAALLQQHIGLENPQILVLGAGDMADLAVFALHKYGYRQIAVMNRSFARGQALAQKFGLEAHEWAELWQQITQADAVITATGAPNTLIHGEEIRAIMAEREKSLLLIDIAVPRDIAPEVAQIEGVRLFDIDALKGVVDENLALRQAAIPQVQAIIAEEAERYLAWLNERQVVPLIVDLRREVASLVESELQNALDKLSDLSEDEQAVVKRMAHRITNKVLHQPTISLKAAKENSVEYAQIVRELFALDFQQD